jgi:hypothetical protein
MLCSTLPIWITYATRGVLVTCAILVIVLMQKAEHDKSIGRVDSKTLRAARRFSFWAIALCVVGVLLTDGNPIAQLMLYISTGAVLVVDIVAMIFRPPETGHKAASLMRWSPVRHIAARFRRRVL